MQAGTLIEYISPWENKTYIGMITKKASAGYWVLWGDGSHKIILKRFLKYTRIV